ncbi:MAG: hypothetical protein CMO81_09380 [Waddliaceae bacterium]|nr:hypothetical protein [Waddliaceae bacterium]
MESIGNEGREFYLNVSQQNNRENVYLGPIPEQGAKTHEHHYIVIDDVPSFQKNPQTWKICKQDICNLVNFLFNKEVSSKSITVIPCVQYEYGNEIPVLDSSNVSDFLNNLDKILDVPYRPMTYSLTPISRDVKRMKAQYRTLEQLVHVYLFTPHKILYDPYGRKGQGNSPREQVFNMRYSASTFAHIKEVTPFLYVHDYTYSGLIVSEQDLIKRC